MSYRQDRSSRVDSVLRSYNSGECGLRPGRGPFTR